MVRGSDHRHGRLDLASSALLLFFERSFFSTMPVLKLSPFRRPDFRLGLRAQLVIGFGLYSATYLTPMFLGRVRDYSSLEIGTTVFVAGIAHEFGAPLAARLTHDDRPAHGDRRRLFAVRACRAG